MGVADDTFHGYEPTHAVPPGETLREQLENLEMSQADLARRTGLSTKTINQIALGAASLTPETALLLEKATGIPARIWNLLEAQWREHLARVQEKEALAHEAEWLNTLPIEQLQQRGWLPRLDNQGELVRAVCSFFGVANRQAWHGVWRHPRAAFRRSTKFTIEEGATAAWLRLGELKARAIECRPYDARQFRRSLEAIRSATVEPISRFEDKIVRLCAEAGVALVFVPELEGTRANGATQWLSPSKALMQLSLRYKREDIFWFSLFHEAGHILLHGKRNLFVEASPEAKAEDFFLDDQKAEEEADIFARDFLIPPEYGRKLASLRRLDEIKDFATELGIAPAIVVGRLQHDGILPWSRGHTLIRRFEFAENVR